MRIIKHFFTVIALLFLTNMLVAQVQGKLELLSDNKTYQVSVIPDITLIQALSRTNSAQITLLAPTGGLTLTNLQSTTGEWDISSTAIAPTENHSFDYFSVALLSPIEDIAYMTGVEIILFTFENDAICISDIAIIDDNTDPFLPPNSQNLNVGNLFTILGAGPVNAYRGSVVQTAPCPTPLDAMVSLTANNLNCHDDLTSFVLDINGGEAPFTIIWTNTETQAVDSLISTQFNTPITIQNIAVGDYSIQIIDAKNGGTTLSQSINAPEPMELDFAITFSNCEASKDGIVEITDISGGAGDYRYEWNNGVSNSTLINNLDADTYIVTVTDANDCVFTKEAIVKMDGWIDLKATPIDISCFGMGDGQIETVATGKNPPFTYDWEGNGQTGTTANLRDLESGDYSITATDATGVCNQAMIMAIAEPEEVSATAFIDSSSICELKTENTLTVSQVTNNRGTVQYSLDGINFQESNIFTVDAGQSYTVTVEDAANCVADIDIDVPSPSGLSVALPSDLTLNLGDDMQIEADFSATTNVYFEWTPANGLSCNDCPNPMATPTNTTSYTLTVSDDNGCVKEASVIVYLSTTRRVYSPNTFSPNGDGLNDLFTIFTSTDAFSVNSLQIFNRWGDRVYEAPPSYEPSDEYNHGWDGRFNGIDAPIGVYVFMAEIEFIDGKKEIFSGEVNLLR